MDSVRKMLLTTLANLANDNGESWHGHESLASLCGCSRRSVIRHLEALEKDGFLRITKRTSAGMKTSNLYTLIMGALPTAADVTESHIVMPESHIDVTLSPNGCDSVSDRCDRESHKTPIKLPVKLLGGARNESTRARSLAEDLGDMSWANN